MEAVFLKILNLSINAGWLSVAVILLRLILKKAPKWINCLLWGMVGLRLLFPFSIESALSLIPSGEVIPSDIAYQKTPEIQSGIPHVNEIVNPIIATLSPEAGDSANPMQVVIFISSIIWLAGIAIMLLYSLISFISIRIKTREAVLYGSNIYLCDNIGTPFILGIFKPRIYINSDISKMDIGYCLAHERAHLKRRDHLIKPFGFILLSIYWFNPLMWLSYVLLCRDIEYAADEKVLKSLGEKGKKPYSEALVNCSVKRRMIAACPVAFGETGVKGRIKSVLNFKKPTVWVIMASLVISSFAAVFFLTNPLKEDKKDISSVGGADGPTSVITEKEMREKYPEYYNISAQNGLKIYVWQMGVGNYSCILVEGNKEVLNTELINYNNPATIEEMEVILSRFDGSDKDIKVITSVHPASSYYYVINSEYLENLSKKFGGLKVYSVEPLPEANNPNAASTTTSIKPRAIDAPSPISETIITPPITLSAYTPIPYSGSNNYVGSSLYSPSTATPYTYGYNKTNVWQPIAWDPTPNTPKTYVGYNKKTYIGGEYR